MRALLLAWLFVAAAGCGKKSVAHAGADAGAKKSPINRPGRSPLGMDAKSRQPNLRRTLAPITVEATAQPKCSATT